MAQVNNFVLTSEVACVNSVQTIVSNTAWINLASAAANVQNGNTFRVSIAGVTPAYSNGSTQFAPGTVVQIAVGPNGNAADPILASVSIPGSLFGSQSWTAEALLTCRKNATLSGGANANTQWAASVLSSPVSNPSGFGFVSQSILNPAANGVANVQLSGTANAANITVLVTAAAGVNASALVEQLVISQVN